MDKKQTWRLDSFNRLHDFNTKYATDLATIPDYAAEQTEFDDALSAILAAGQVQVHEGGSSEQTIETAKKTMADAVVKYALRGAVKANRLGNTTLAAMLDVTVTYIMKANKNKAVLVSKDVRGHLNDNLAILTNITAANIAEIDAAIDAYDTIKDTAVEEVQNKKAFGTDALKQPFKTCLFTMDNMYNLVRSYFEDSNPQLVDEMRLAIELIDTGVRHTDVEIAVIDAVTNLPITGAEVWEGDHKQFFTDAEGVAHIGSHRMGDFTFTIKAAGYQKASLTAHVLRGKHSAFTIHLQQ